MKNHGKMEELEPDPLSRRERQIMDVVVRMGNSSVREVWEQLPDAPSYSTVRKLLTVLEDKGHVKHREAGKVYIYSATRPHGQMADSALRRIRDTFFNGSVEQVMTGLLGLNDTRLGQSELSRIRAMIEQAKQSETEEANHE